MTTRRTATPAPDRPSPSPEGFPIRLTLTASLTALAALVGLATLAAPASANRRPTTPARGSPQHLTPHTGPSSGGHLLKPPGANRTVGTAGKRFARETVRYGDQDASPAQIEHVRELQYRLTWAGAYDGPGTGYFGDLTKAAVQRFQRRNHLPASGTAGATTWRHLIPATIRGRGDVPDACDHGTGWDACYDRARHEVTLWHDGRLHNAWLVRGGATDHRTRTGDFTVHYRDIDHVSGLYGSPMPYSQFFSGGQAFHGSTTMVDPFTGHSHGCINMYVEDARQLWALTARVSLAVHVYGAWS